MDVEKKLDIQESCVILLVAVDKSHLAALLNYHRSYRSHQQKMIELLSPMKDPNFLSNANLAPQGFMDAAAILKFAPIFKRAYPLLPVLVSQLIDFGYLSVTDVVLSKANGDYLTSVEITEALHPITAPLMLVVGEKHIPVYINAANGIAQLFIQRATMPATPATTDFVQFAVTPIMGQNAESSMIMGVGAVMSMADPTSPMMPALQALIRLRFTTHAGGTDKAGHIRAMGVALQELSQGQTPSNIAPPYAGMTKAKDVKPGVYHVSAVTERIGKFGPEYSGTVKLLCGWNDLADMAGMASTVEELINSTPNPVQRQIDVKTALGSDRTRGSAFDSLSVTLSLDMMSTLFFMVTPYQLTSPQGHPFVDTDGIDTPVSTGMAEFAGSVGIRLIAKVQSAIGKNSPVAAGYKLDPYSMNQVQGSVIAPPSMMPAQVATQQLPAAAMPMPVMASAAPVDDFIDVPVVAAAIPAPVVAEVVDIPFDFAPEEVAAATPVLPTVPMSMPAAVPAPPAAVPTSSTVSKAKAKPAAVPAMAISI